MPLRVRCPQCQKSSQFSDSDAGLTALCVACGARFTIPDQSSPEFQAAQVPRENELAHAAQAVAAMLPATPINPPPIAPHTPNPTPDTPQPTPPIRPLTPLSSRPHPVLYTLLGAACTVLIVLAAVIFYVLKPTWEDDHRARLRQLKADAEELAIDGKLPQAYDTYRQLDLLIAGRAIKDRGLASDMEAARAAQAELFKILFNQSASAYGAQAKPVPTTPATKPIQTANTNPPANQDNTVSQNWPAYQPTPIRTTPKPLVKNTAPEPVTSEKPNPLDNIPAKPVVPKPTITVRPPDNSGAVVQRQRPDVRVRRLRAQQGDSVTDEEIGRAIQSAVNHLINQFQDGRLRGGGGRQDAYYAGLNALCVYALLQSSYAIKDERLNPKGPFMKDLISKMKDSSMEQGPVTYARGIRATALALIHRSEDKEALKADVAYLINSHNGGAYTYQALGRRGNYPNARAEGPWDNSNSQYGLLGVWSGAEVGVEVNNAYWQAVESHWTRSQLNNGEWDYSGYGGSGPGRLSMTLAGLASLFVTHDYLDAPKFGTAVGREPFSKPLLKGLSYLEQGDNSVSINGGYSLYGLERVGLASGFKYFGNHNWYPELARAVVNSQAADGGWGSQVETAYHLLFLARGRHPVLMNKLRYEGPWANRPRDLANLARFASKELERQLNWQVVPLSREWTDWNDSPILYISSHLPPKFSDEQIDKIRSFVLAGGMLFTQADGNAIPASAEFERLAKKLFPKYEMKDLPADHEIFNILYKPSPRPNLRHVSNGSRVLMVHSPSDITGSWQLRQDKSKRSLFELGTNLFLYAAGKGDLKNRLASSYIAPPRSEPGGGVLKIARLKYPSNWDPEPIAWTRFTRYFQHETDVGLNLDTIELDELQPTSAHLAVLTGTAPYAFTDREIASVRGFVEAGGILLIDSTGGTPEFTDSARTLLQKAFPADRPQLVARNHPMMSSGPPGMDDLSTPLVRPFTKSKSGGFSGRIEQVHFGKGRAILSPLDLTSGLLGANTWGIHGFDPVYACELVKNILIWSATSMKDE